MEKDFTKQEYAIGNIVQEHFVLYLMILSKGFQPKRDRFQGGFYYGVFVLKHEFLKLVFSKKMRLVINIVCHLQLSWGLVGVCKCFEKLGFSLWRTLFLNYTQLCSGYSLDCSQGLQLEILRGLYRLSGLEPWLTVCKASTQPVILFLETWKICLF